MFLADLEFSRVIENEVLKKIRKVFPKAELEGVNDSTCDIDCNLKIEIKRERAVKKYGNVAVELSYKGRPSGVNASKSDVWIWEIDGHLWWCNLSHLKKWLKKNKNKYQIKMGGDGRQSELAILSLITFCNEVAIKIK